MWVCVTAIATAWIDFNEIFHTGYLAQISVEFVNGQNLFNRCKTTVILNI